MTTSSSETTLLRSLSLSACAAILSMFASGAQAAPDGTLGSALLAARIQSDGSFLNGAGYVSSAKLATGQYEVIFNRDVTGCFYNAVSFTGTVAEFVQPRSGNPNGVFVIFSSLGTTSTNPANTDSQFYMTVFCVR